MTLRSKFVAPINLVLVLVLAASLAWEWRRQEATGMALLRARLDEEARFIRVAYGTYGLTPRFSRFLEGFCHAIDPAASPEHQVALVGRSGEVIAGAAEHARRPMDLARLAASGDGFRLLRQGEEIFLVRVVADGDHRVVVAESTDAVRQRVRGTLWSHALWYLGLGGLLLVAVNVVMSRAVLRPIRRLGRAVSRMERGHLGVQVDLAGGDELGALARRFRHLKEAMSSVVCLACGGSSRTTSQATAGGSPRPPMPPSPPASASPPWRRPSPPR